MVIKTAPPRAPVRPDDHEYHNGIYYPSEDGKPMAENDYQVIALLYVGNALKDWFADADDVYVIVDMLVYYSEGDNSSSFAPDAAVIYGVSPYPRYSWMAWREGGILPSLIVEVASPTTWANDAGGKRNLYARLGVREYWRHNPDPSVPAPALIGERLVNGRYRRIPATTDENGILRSRSELLGLDFCIRPDLDDALRLYDPRSGRWLLSAGEANAAHQQSETARRQAETARRQAEAENRELRELIAQLRGEG